MIAAPVRDTRFMLSDQQVRDLAGRHGTPLYVVDERHFRRRIRETIRAAKAAWPKCEVSFASKANSTAALLKIAYQESCGIDVASEGELRVALAAGIPASACHFHGNNKQEEELVFALDQGIGAVVVDHFGEIELLGTQTGHRRQQVSRRDACAPEDSSPPTKIILRLAPGVDPKTHAKISTGQADTKFGFNIADGSAEDATLRCLALGLDLIGFHCHVGSQLVDPEAQRAGGEFIARFARDMLHKHGFSASYLNVGGGLGVHYTDCDQPMALEQYHRLVADTVKKTLEGSGLEPTLGHEPGRSLIAESGVTLYRIGVIKSVPSNEIGLRTYVCVDGGLSDNPRPAMYNSEYTILHTSLDNRAPARERTVRVAGKHCETDTLFEGARLPENAGAGDLIQVLCTGAYNSSMANNYNRYPRPATVLLRNTGGESLIQRRETFEEMLAREILPEDL